MDKKIFPNGLLRLTLGTVFGNFYASLLADDER